MNRLRQCREGIQDRWLRSIRAELRGAQDQDEPALLDNIPQIIENLATLLERGSADAERSELFERHAQCRVDWSRYSGEEIVREYGILRKILFSELEQEQPLTREERDLILDFIQHGIEIGSARYTETQRLHERLELQYLKLIEHLVVESGRTGALEGGFERLLDVVILGLGAEAAAFFLYDDGTLDVTLSSASARNESLAQAYRGAFAMSAARAHHSDADEAVQPIDVAELEPSGRESVTQLGISWLVLVRISADRHAPGTLCIGFRERRELDPLEHRLLAALGDRLALLLTSLELKAQSTAALERLRRQNDMIEAERNSLDEERRRRDEIIAAISHDLKNPLSTAKMGAEMLRMGATTPATTERLAERILQSIGRSDRMIHDLLDSQRIRAGKRLPLDMQKFNMNDLVQAVVEDMTRLHGDRFVVRAEPDVSGFWSWESMRRALENLLTNAVKYSPGSTPITISLSANSGTRTHLSVHNEGPGLSREEQARVFEPFERGASAELSGKRGWGIGLTLVKGIIDSHGGVISVDSTPDGGTTFTIDNPMDSRLVQ